MMTAEHLRSLLEESIPDSKARVTDLTGTMDHYAVDVVSPVFAGKSLIEQHKIVHAAVGEYLTNEIHAPPNQDVRPRRLLNPNPRTAMWNPDRVREEVQSEPLVVFAKGTKDQPMCGFSAKAIDLLLRTGKPFKVVNIFDDPNIRPALVEFSQWPTTPQVFIKGELMGGSDIVEEMFVNGELQKKIDEAFAPA